jgi:hypothetical protein
MHGFLVEEVTTLVGFGTPTLSQGANGWVDLHSYCDVIAWLTTHELNAGNGTLQIGYQTAALPQDDSFITMTGPLVTVPLTPTVGTQQVTPMLKDLMTVPLARWFRWQLISTATNSWDITFTLRLSANCLLPRHKRSHGSHKKE